MQQNASNASPRETKNSAGGVEGIHTAHSGRIFIVPAVIAVVVLAADRATKILAETYLAMHAPREVVGEYLRLVLWYNEGAAFGVRLGNQLVHVALSLAAMALIAYMLWLTPKSDRMSLWGFGLIIGGAVGNLWDRLLAGKVTDFIDAGIGVYRWPTFNVADSCVVVGIGLLILAHLRFHRTNRTSTEANAEQQPVETEHAP